MTGKKYNAKPKSDVAGLKTVPSGFEPKETMDRLEAAIKAQGMRVFARINHAALAAEIGITLRPTELLIFGHPRSGTPLMQATQTMGIDLPLKALVWQDETGKTWLAYNEPGWLARRHGVEPKGAVQIMARMLGATAKKVTELT